MKRSFGWASYLKRMGRNEPRQGPPGPRDADRRANQGGAPRTSSRCGKRDCPPTPTLFERLGAICGEVGMVAESRAWLEQSIKLQPDGADGAGESSHAWPAHRTRCRLRCRIRELAVKASESRAAAANSRADHRRVAETDSATLASAAPVPPFADRSVQAGVNYRYDSGSSDRLFIADTMGGGVGLFDYDNDGWLDIYFVNGCAIPFDSEGSTASQPACTAIKGTERSVT